MTWLTLPMPGWDTEKSVLYLHIGQALIHNKVFSSLRIRNLRFILILLSFCQKSVPQHIPEDLGKGSL